MEVYSHRGIGLGPENSLTSMREAKKRGLNYETDVRKTADGELVPWHDPGLVENKTYAELTKFAKPGTELYPARLEDALRLNPQAKPRIINLEIKSGVKGREVLKKVEKYDRVEHYLFTSFYPWKVRQIKKKTKEATVGLLTKWRLPKILLPVIAKAGMDYILPHTDTITEGFVKKAHHSGLKVVSWCRSNEEIKQNNQDCGVDGMIVNL